MFIILEVVDNQLNQYKAADFSTWHSSGLLQKLLSENLYIVKPQRDSHPPLLSMHIGEVPYFQHQIINITTRLYQWNDHTALIPVKSAPGTSG